jgi:hypothetical protein
MHYEFLFRQKKLYICLHLEAKDEDLCQKIYEKLSSAADFLAKKIPFKLEFKAKDRHECFFEIPFDLRIDRTGTYALVMYLLMKRSFSILSKFDGVLSETFRFAFSHTHRYGADGQ